MCVCVHVCCVHVCVCVYTHVCVLDREGRWVVASRALVVVVQTAIYLTGYSDCATSFHAGLENV